MTISIPGAGTTRALVTGGAGFIGHHLVRHLLLNTDWTVTCLDRLDVAGNLNRLHEVVQEVKPARGRLRLMFHDLRAEISDQVGRQIGEQEFVFHLAASTHVDRSITDPALFVQDNVLGTTHLLLWARKFCSQAFLYFSSDEVFGPALDGERFREWARYRSMNPYSASKAGAEEMCLAFFNTYGVPVKIVHAMNGFGERQHPEKYIPLVIRSVLNGKKIKIHADNTCRTPGSRFYIHAEHLADAAVFAARHLMVGDKLNITGDREVDNLTLASNIAEIIGKPLHSELVAYTSSRPGHDLRYELDDSKLRGMGWRIPVPFDQMLERTVRWTLDNRRWL